MLQHTFTRTHLHATAALAVMLLAAICAVGGYTIAGRGDHLPASCFTDDTNRCLSE